MIFGPDKIPELARNLGKLQEYKAKVEKDLEPDVETETDAPESTTTKIK